MAAAAAAWLTPGPALCSPPSLRSGLGAPPAGLGLGWGKGALRGEGRALSIPEGPGRQGQGAKGL